MAELDPCPYCGQDGFGNAGARTQHVNACQRDAEKYTNQQQQTQPDTVDSNGSSSGAEPSLRQTTQTTPDDNALASAGEDMASGLSATLDEDAPVETRKEGVKNLASLAGGLLNGVMDYKAKKEQVEEERARNVDLQQTQDKPSCECGLTFSRIPQNAQRVSCPECGREYEVR